MRFGALVFDLDGTLTDPLEGIWRSTNHALAAHGAPTLERADFVRFIGPPIDQTFRALIPDLDDRTVNRLVGQFRERYRASGYAENLLYPEVPAMLDAVTGAGYRCGLCTAKRRDFAELVLGLFELDPFFEFIDGGDVGVRKASQLEGLLASGQIDSRAVMIGDRASDLEAASANGLAAIGVAWGYGSAEELAAAGPLAIAGTPGELARILLDG